MPSEQILSFFPLIISCYISYRTLKVTDLSIDGTYILGAAVFARVVPYAGAITASVLSLVSGVVVGIIVALMQRDDKVNDLLVGILVSFMLYSINLQIMGRPNISVLNQPTILSVLRLDSWIEPLAILVILISLTITLALKSDIGLMMRAFGHNKELLKRFDKSIEKYRLFGLAFSGGLASLSGALASQINGFSDINMGTGIALISIGMLVIGGGVIIDSRKPFNLNLEILSCLVGSILYFLCLDSLLYFELDPINLKLVMGLTLFCVLRRYGG
jgi:putative ABC transport system permease protein